MTFQSGKSSSQPSVSGSIDDLQVNGASCANLFKKSETNNHSFCLPVAHCLPVARALIKFLLYMDLTVNIDLFLLTCNVSTYHILNFSFSFSSIFSFLWNVQIIMDQINLKDYIIVTPSLWIQWNFFKPDSLRTGNFAWLKWRFDFADIDMCPIFPKKNETDQKSTVKSDTEW